MTLAGYNAAVGGFTNLVDVGSSDRVVGRLNLGTGIVDTTTALTGFNTSATTVTAARGATSTDGNDIWVATNTGVRYVTFGVDNPGTGVSVGASANNGRRNVVFGNTLYQTESANSRSGVESIGPVGGPPPVTAGSGAVSLLPGFPTVTTTYAPQDFFFANANTIYMADDMSTVNKGLVKFTFDGTNWVKVYANPVGVGNLGIKGLTGTVDAGGNVVMFATTVGVTGGNLLYGLTDTLSNTSAGAVTENLLVTASTAFGGAQWNLRGLAIAPVPEPTGFAVIAMAGMAALSRRRRA